MSGAFLQLAALGSQDVYLSSNPEITLFKSVYKRYTHFSMETEQLNFDGANVELNNSNIFTATLGNGGGDLIYKCVLVIKLEANSTNTWGYVNNLGHAIIDEISVSIGQTDVDTIYGDWLENWHSLTRNSSHDEGYNKMIGNVQVMTDYKENHPEYTLYIPLHFWFTRQSSLAYPICSSTRQPIQFRVKLKNAVDIINYPGTVQPTSLPRILNGYFLIDKIYLDPQERTLFMNNNHEYLIEQIQELESNINSNKFQDELTFDKSCKFLIWNINLARYFNRNSFLSWAYDGDWENAKNEFAKLIYLVSRENLNTTDISNPYVVIPSTLNNIGNGPSKITNGGTKLLELANKVDGLMLFTQLVGSEYRAEAKTSNVVLTKNDITMEDISLTINELKDSTITANQSRFLDSNSHQILNIFNSGNFIDGSNNPIVDSRLQLNGKDKFQKNDGKYFNYVQSHYNFRNIAKDGLNTFSFALDPMNDQPTGTINFTFASSQQLNLTFGKNNIDDNGTHFNNFIKSGRLRMFVQNYAILKILPKLNRVQVVY